MLRKTLSFLSTPVGISLILALLVIGIASLIKTQGGDVVTEKGPAALAVEKLIKKSLEDDTDGDGLKNWEESLYKTDPEDADTDGDGVHDGAEIATNRDPLIAGAGDGTSSTTSSAGIQFSETDRFSQEIFMKYLEAKKSGQEITQEFSEAIAEEILAKDYGLPEAIFDVNTLSIIKNPTIYQIYEYGNEFGAIVSTPIPKNVRSELVILDSIQNQGLTQKDSAELQLLSERYLAMRNDLASISVPSEMKNTHGSFIHAIDTLRNGVIGMQTIDTDPIGALKKIALYESALNELSIAATSLKQYFVSKKITFDPTDSGSAIMR